MVPDVPRRLAAVATALLVVAGCRGRPIDADRSSEIQHLVDSLVPLVEEASGLAFSTPPKWALRNSEQLRDFLQNKFREQLPPEVLNGLETAYRLFGFIPDTLQLERLFLDVLLQQVQGFYEPDSATLYLVEDAQLGTVITLTHELVHALQDQHLSLDSLLDPRTPNDRLMALQAVLEGQAQFVSFSLIAKKQVQEDGFWDLAADETRRAAVGQLGDLPLVLRESLLFPYLDGARFMAWWSSGPLADTMPYGPRMPVSTEQVLFPNRYLAGEEPVPISFTDSSDAVLYQDGLGEFMIRVLQAQLTGQTRAHANSPMGWNGDRYRAYRSPQGPALVWYTAWDDTHAADRFAEGTAALLAGLPRSGVRGAVERTVAGGVPLVRVIVAPIDWPAWGSPPAVAVGP